MPRPAPARQLPRLGRHAVGACLVCGFSLVPNLTPVRAHTADGARFFEPKQGYYGARGPAVAAEWVVERDTVREDEALAATLVVRGATNPRDVARPDLRKLPAYAERFDPIEDVPAPPPAADATEVAFVYRLRPRNRGVDRLPALDFYFLKPGITAGDPFQNRRVKSRPVTVTAAPATPPPPPTPLAAPDHLFAVTTGAAVLDRPAAAPGPWLVLTVAALAPLAAAGWYAAWRRAFPDAARVARRRRSAAARRALAAVRRAASSVDPAAGFAAAVAGYARARFAVPPGAETPAEVGAAVRAAGAAAGSADAVEAFLRRCDAARFGPAGDAGPSLGADAAALVARVEAAG